MTESSPYPLLEPWRIIARCKHLGIVITFQYKRVALAQGRFDVRRRTAGIRENTQPPPSVAKHELRRFLGVMGHRIGLDLDRPYRETLIATDDIDLRQQPECSFDPAPGTVGQPYRNSQLAGEPGDTAYMIAMLVRNHNRLDRFGLNTKPAQASVSFLQRKAAIEQQSRFSRFHYETVTLGTAS